MANTLGSLTKMDQPGRTFPYFNPCSMFPQDRYQLVRYLRTFQGLCHFVFEKAHKDTLTMASEVGCDFNIYIEKDV